MKGHIKNNMLLSLKEGLLSESEQKKLFTHIQSCNSCKKRYDLIKKIYAPTIKKNSKPSEKVINNILNYYDKTVENNNQNEFKQKFRPFKYLKHGTALVFTALVIITSSFLIKQFNPFNTETAKEKNLVINISNKVGSISVNNQVTRDQLKAGNVLKTGKKSGAKISIKNLMNISIKEMSSIEILEAIKINNKKNSDLRFAFLITKGSFDIEFKHTGNLFYSFKTPHALITSGGTKFILLITEKSTEVIMREGHVNILPINKNSKQKPIIAQSGKNYSIYKKGKFKKVEKNNFKEKSNKESLNSQNDIKIKKTIQRRKNIQNLHKKVIQRRPRFRK